MKIIVYCQHTLGIGHFFRTLEICRALAGHEVILVTGGPAVGVALPGHVREVRLPALKMDVRFKGLYADAGDMPVARIKEERQQRLFALFEKERPDLFLVELYPFGRKKFRFELDPVLEAIENKTLAPCRVVCSLRDILVEKDGGDGYEDRVIRTVNRWFHEVWVHADPQLVKLTQTFPNLGRIDVPFVYTGFVTPKPSPDARRRIREKLNLGDKESLIVVSAGGGKVGAPLLEAAAKAFFFLPKEIRPFMALFAGLFADNDALARLNGMGGERLRIRRFTEDFPSYLAAGDLSVSMAGYNTCMNIMAARTPALVLPFDENREQRMRAEKLARLGQLGVLAPDDLAPPRLAGIMTAAMARTPAKGHGIDLEGAARTARLVTDMAETLRGE